MRGQSVGLEHVAKRKRSPALAHSLTHPRTASFSSSLFSSSLCVCVCVYTIDVTCLALRQNLCQSSRWVSVFCPSRDSSHTTHDDDNSFVFSFSDKSKDEWEGPTKSLIKFHRCCCSAAGVAKRLNQQNINFFFALFNHAIRECIVYLHFVTYLVVWVRVCERDSS